MNSNKLEILTRRNEGAYKRQQSGQSQQCGYEVVAHLFGPHVDQGFSVRAILTKLFACFVVDSCRLFAPAVYVENAPTAGVFNKHQLHAVHSDSFLFGGHLLVLEVFDGDPQNYTGNSNITGPFRGLKKARQQAGDRDNTRNERQLVEPAHSRHLCGFLGGFEFRPKAFEIVRAQVLAFNQSFGDALNVGAVSDRNITACNPHANLRRIEAASDQHWPNSWSA